VIAEEAAMHSEELTEFGVAPPHPELKRLEPLLGNWKAENRTLESVLGPGVPVSSTEAFQWLEGGYFLVQEYETTFGDEPTQRGVNYWFYDAEVDRFRIIFFSNNGPFSEEGNRYEGRVGDGRLTFVGRRVSSTSWTTTAISRSLLTARSLSPGRYGTRPASGNRG
jgi:Protein of unknown function (DUF1579)